MTEIKGLQLKVCSFTLINIILQNMNESVLLRIITNKLEIKYPEIDDFGLKNRFIFSKII